MRQSDETRFNGLVRAHGAGLFRTAYLLTGDHQRAEDLLHRTLVRVYQRWPRTGARDRPLGDLSADEDGDVTPVRAPGEPPLAWLARPPAENPHAHTRVTDRRQA